jgi:pilus assembly protein Flp/PilA
MSRGRVEVATDRRARTGLSGVCPEEPVILIGNTRETDRGVQRSAKPPLRDELGQTRKGGGERGKSSRADLARIDSKGQLSRKEAMVFQKVQKHLSRLDVQLKRQEGQALVEYALILAMIAVVSILILKALGLSVSGVLNTVNTQLSVVP